MDAASPFIDMVHDFMVLEPAHRFPSCGKVHVAGLNVPIPNPVVTASHGELPSFFACPERVFNLFAFGNVEDGAVHPDRVTGRIPLDFAASMEDPHFAAGSYNATFQIKGGVVHERGVHGSQHPVMVIRQ